jgi:iron complex transport system substrate-binding protein
MSLPERILCLSGETVETLYLLGAEDRICGITAFAERPAAARRDKPVVAGFSTADIPAILALEPDLVLGFSDVQADILAALMRHGLAVHGFNQRSLAGILEMVGLLGAVVGALARADALVAELAAAIAAARGAAAALPSHPRLYFEEWDEPPVCGIGWISETIALAGGTDIFADRALMPAARARGVTYAEIIARGPEAIVASWCGKKFSPQRLMARPGFDGLPAVRYRRLYELAGAIILQPGPAVITDGLPALQRIVEACLAGPAGPLA